MRVLAFILSILLLVSVPGVAEGSRSMILPSQFDWSTTQTVRAVYTSNNDRQPAIRDEEGNFHIVSIEGVENAPMVYTILNPDGEVISRISPEVPKLTRMATYFVDPEGLMVIWAAYDVIPVRGVEAVMAMYAAKISTDGEILEYHRLDYQLPQGAGEQLERFTYFNGVDAALDGSGNIHVVLHAGYSRSSGPGNTFGMYYLRYSPEFELEYADVAGVTSGPGSLLGGEVTVDDQGNAYIIHSFIEDVVLTKFDTQGVKVFEEVVGEQVYRIGTEWWDSEYYLRKRGPTLAVEPDGTVHLAHNFLVDTGRGMGQEVVDIRYVQVKGGEVVREKVLTGGRGISRFPTITRVGELVAVTWEQPVGMANQVLVSSILSTAGEPLVENLFITDPDGFNRSGLVWVDEENHINAFWWRGPGSTTTVAHKNTRNPVAVTIWHRFGIVNEFSERTPIEQIFYWFSMVLMFAVVRVFNNLDILLMVIIGLFILYKLQLLELVKEKPWLLLTAVILACYILLQPMELAEEVAGTGYYFFSAVGATGLLLVCSLLLKIRYYSTVNLLFACVAWMFLVMVFQVLPVVPYLTTL